MIGPYKAENRTEFQFKEDLTKNIIRFGKKEIALDRRDMVEFIERFTV